MSLDYLVLAFNYFVLGYFVVLNTIYLMLLVFAAREMFEHLHRTHMDSAPELATSPLVPGVSILAPAYNEEAGIVDSVRSLLALHYPRSEVVVVSDGSRDATIARLVEAFGLVQAPYAYAPTIPTQQLRAVYVAPGDRRLLVADKANGGKADALNCGINLSSMELVCAIDADSVLDDQALLRSCRLFIDDPERVVATGGIVRIANGCEIDRGYLTKVGLPKSRIAGIQVMEYLRAFLAGRSGWSRINSLMIISGAFGVFRRDVVKQIGGYRTDTVGEDGELVVRMHRHLREQRRDYRIAFVPDPVCWTEAPEDLHTLRKQRGRWHRGLAEILWAHKRMMFNPRYGWMGMLAMPFALVFELLGPIVELTGIVAVPVGWYLGIINTAFLIIFTVMALLFGIFLSVAALALEEVSLRRYPRARQLAALVAYAVLENLGYRQLTALWRSWAIVQWLRGNKEWGAMQRRGLSRPADSDAVSAAATTSRPAAPPDTHDRAA
jgi:cellulose synthase/poly-beta-1,6-N-acetylglucosamine synthase-like glycosyltransferase